MRGIPWLVLAACTDPLASDFAIERVDPPQGPVGVQMPVAIEGTFHLPITSNLDQGQTSVELPVATVDTVPIDNVVWESERLITGTIPDTLPVGTYDVTVTLGGRTETLAGGYTVIDGSAPLPFAFTGAWWQLPCDPGTNSMPNNTACHCGSQSSTVVLGGNAGDRWHVTARIRGVLEYMVYTGGVQGAGDSYVGGAQSDAGNNVYLLEIDHPPTKLFINSNALANTQQNSWPIDFTIQFDVEGDATLNTIATGQDGIQWEGVDAGDADIIIPDITEPPQHFNGQFARLDILTAVPF